MLQGIICEILIVGSSGRDSHALPVDAKTRLRYYREREREVQADQSLCDCESTPVAVMKSSDGE